MEKYGMGDVRQSRKKWDAAENQPLTAQEKGTGRAGIHPVRLFL